MELNLLVLHLSIGFVEVTILVERRKIVELWEGGKPGTIVTLVGVQGSSYRRPGARLFVTSDTHVFAGGVSGGCLEGELVRKSAWHTRNGASVVRYSMAMDDVADIPFGLGCGGVVDILFEDSTTPEGAALLKAAEASLLGFEALVKTFLPINGNPLQRAVVADGNICFASPGLSDERIFRSNNASDTHGGTFQELMQSPQRLFVLGAGDDAKAVVAMGALLGWTVSVVDGRTHLATPHRFPDARRLISGSQANGRRLGINEKDAVILMTHSYEQDRSFLLDLLPLNPRYIGLLGSQHRSALLMSEVSATLRLPLQDCCSKIYAPMGFDLGGEGPEAIALAVIAEAQSVCMRGIGSERRLMPEVITRLVKSGNTIGFRSDACIAGFE